MQVCSERKKVNVSVVNISVVLIMKVLISNNLHEGACIYTRKRVVPYVPIDNEKIQ